MPDGSKLPYRFMKYRIHKILLVCCSYDGYILEEDGHIEQQINQEYIDLNMSNPPSLTRVSSTAEALEALDRTLALSAEPSGDPTPRSIQVLSQGAADQLYLAVRLAICGMVLPAEKRVPLILDDALVTFDDTRLRAALDYLLAESAQRQILLFTCQNRERDYLAGRENVNILTL